MEGSELASALMDRIAPLLGGPVEFTIVGGAVEFIAPVTNTSIHSGRLSLDLDDLLYEGANSADPAIYACEHFLDQLQDFVAKATAEPWPGSRVMPRPVAAMSGGLLVITFRCGSDVVLALDPIAW